MPRTSSIVCIFILVVLSLVSLRAGAARKNFYVTVAAGAFDRRGTVVSFALPTTLNKTKYALLDDQGRVSATDLQVDAHRRATFVLPELKAGATKTYRVVTVTEIRGVREREKTWGVRLTKEGNCLVTRSDGREVLRFLTSPELPDGVKPVFARAGYIHPVYTPSGRMVTDDYPPDHHHHHGIWAAWTKTDFEGRHPDFWNVGDGSGRVDFVGVDHTWEGTVHGGFGSRQRYIDVSGPQPKTALEEKWEVTVYRVGQSTHAHTMFDLVVTQECATSSPLTLQEYRYGGVGVRGHREWKDKSKISFLTSEGRDRSNGNATRGRWCHIGGTVGGQLAGITTFDHPGNFRAPQSMRINPEDPFFNWAPSQLGSFVIAPGQPFVLRYRFVAADGPPDKSGLERLWNDYAHPPIVTITSK